MVTQSYDDHIISALLLYLRVNLLNKRPGVRKRRKRIQMRNPRQVSIYCVAAIQYPQTQEYTPGPFSVFDYVKIGSLTAI